MFLFLAAPTADAASDADVRIIKAQTVLIEDGVITIVGEVNASVTVIQGAQNSGHKGATWRGRPATRVQIHADRATLIIKRSPERTLESAWQMSVQAAKDLQDGKEVGRIGYYAPDMVIKDNLITSITGFGFLYPKGQ